MEAEGLLLTIAEVSVAFAGFAGIVAIIGRRGTGEWHAGDLLRFWQMIEVSMLGVIFSLLPFVFYHAGITASQTWAASSAMLAAASGIQMLRAAVRTVKAAGTDGTLSLAFSAGFVLIGLIVIAILVANAVGFLFHQTVAPYVVGIFWNLCLACVLFWRLLKFSGLPYGTRQE